MIGLILSRAGRWLLAALSIIGGVLTFGALQRRAGAKAARQETALEAAERYAETRGAMDDAGNLGDDPGALRDWLRDRDPGTR